MNFREIAKFLSGLFLGDFLAGIWLYSAGELPMNFLGVRLDATGAMWWLGLDAALFLGLVYYAWVRKGPSKKKK